MNIRRDIVVETLRIYSVASTTSPAQKAWANAITEVYGAVIPLYFTRFSWERQDLSAELNVELKHILARAGGQQVGGHPWMAIFGKRTKSEAPVWHYSSSCACPHSYQDAFFRTQPPTRSLT